MAGLVGAQAANYQFRVQAQQQQRFADRQFQQHLIDSSRIDWTKVPAGTGEMVYRAVKKWILIGCIAFLIFAFLYGLTFGSYYEQIKYKVEQDGYSYSCKYYCKYNKASLADGDCNVSTIDYPSSIKSIGLTTLIVCGTFSILYGILAVVTPCACMVPYQGHMLITMIICASLYVAGTLVWIVGGGCSDICNSKGGTIVGELEDDMEYQKCDRIDVYVWYQTGCGGLCLLIAICLFVALRKSSST